MDNTFAAAHAMDYDAMIRSFNRGFGYVLDELGNNVLMIAARSGSKRIVKLAMRKGIDINEVNNFGKSALHQLSSSALGNVKLCDYMIMHGAQVNIADYDGYTPLMDASRQGNSEV